MSLRPAPPRAAEERRTKSAQRGGRLEHVLRIGVNNGASPLTPNLHSFAAPQPEVIDVYEKAIQRRDQRAILGGGGALEPEPQYKSGALRNRESHRDDLGNTWLYHVTDSGMRDRLVSIHVADKRVEPVLHGTLNMAGPAQNEHVLSYISEDGTNSLVFDDNTFPPHVAEMDVSIEWLQANHTAYEKLSPEWTGMQDSMMQGMHFPTGRDRTSHEEHFNNRMHFFQRKLEELPNLWKLHFDMGVGTAPKNTRYSMKLKPEGAYTPAEGNIEHAALKMEVGPLRAKLNFVARKGEPVITLEYTKDFTTHTTQWLEDETEKTPTARGETTFHDIKLIMQEDAKARETRAEYTETAVRRVKEAASYVDKMHKKKLAEYTEAMKDFEKMFNLFSTWVTALFVLRFLVHARRVVRFVLS